MKTINKKSRRIKGWMIVLNYETDPLYPFAFNETKTEALNEYKERALYMPQYQVFPVTILIHK